jgi:nicotinamide/nicotinate riboside kinase
MIIGIGGVSRSGKSLLSRQISQWFSGVSFRIFDQDDYVFPVDRIPRISGETDWECPESIDFDRYYRAVIGTSEEGVHVIAEGLMVFHDLRLVRMMDKKIFVRIPYDLFVERKRPDRRWGPFPEWYIDHIWKSFLRYGQPPENDSGVLTVEGDRPFSEKQIRAYLFP